METDRYGHKTVFGKKEKAGKADFSALKFDFSENAVYNVQ